MHFSPLHPGSNIPLPMVTSPKFASSILPFSNALVSSGEESRLFFHYNAIKVMIFKKFGQSSLILNHHNRRDISFHGEVHGIVVALIIR